MIHRTRKRPRVHSISLRTFGWLCARQAMYQLWPPPATYRDAQVLRLMLMRVPLGVLRGMAAPHLLRNPYRNGGP